MRLLSTCLFSLSIILLPSISLAALPIIGEPLQPYEILATDADIEHMHTYLGELKGDPHMYEVTLIEQKEFSIRILQSETEAGAIPFSLIVVRNNDNRRGVTEIGRVKGDEVAWKSGYDSALGFSLYQTEPITYQLDPGVYRFEISSAENEGKYMLRLGNKSDDSSYSEKLQTIRVVQSFFEVSPLRIIISSTILYPIGCFIILILIWLTWRYQRKKITHV